MRKIQSPEYTLEGFIAKVRKDAEAERLATSAKSLSPQKVQADAEPQWLETIPEEPLPIQRVQRNAKPKKPPTISDLPHHVLAIVFDRVMMSSEVPDSCRVLAPLRLVCSTWADAIDSQPVLWRHIVLRHTRPALTAMPKLFEKSGDVPLSVTLDFRGPPGKPPASIRECTDICSTVSRHLERIETLAIVLAIDHQSLALKYLDRATTCLTTLSVEYCEPSEHNTLAPLKRGLFMNDLSRLRAMRLGYTGLSAVFKPRKPLPCLRTLELTDRAFDWFELEAAFAACPELEDLTIAGFNFVFNGKFVPSGELAVPLPLRWLELQSARVTDINHQEFLAAFARMPLRRTAGVQLGGTFVPWYRSDDTAALLETFFEHLPSLETLGVDMDDELFEMEGIPGDRRFPYKTVARSIALPGDSVDLFAAQDPLKEALARALMLPSPAFRHVSALRMPLTFWYYVNSSVEGMLPHLNALEVVWDISVMDTEVPSLPHLVSLELVRLLKPAARDTRMLLRFDKVEKLLHNYEGVQEVALALCDIRVIQAEDDDLLSLVSRIVIDE